jgi:hypothetical protein
MKLRYSQKLGILNPLAAAHILQHQLVACTSSRRRLEMLPSQSTDYINISVTSLSKLLQMCGYFLNGIEGKDRAKSRPWTFRSVAKEDTAI